MGYWKSRKLENWLGLLGAAGFILYLLANFISPSAYPGYNWMGQAISDLSAQNAPSRELWTKFTTVSSACGLVFATLACLYVQNLLNKRLRAGIYLFAILSWVNTMGYTLFPLTESGYAGTFQDIMHVFVVTAAVVGLSIASFTLIMAGGYRNRKYRSIAIFATISLCGLIAGMIGMGVAPLSCGGVMERLSVFSAQGFGLVLGFYVFIGFDWMERERQTC
jgi:multisubunit Na+/H+ antiporter MnhC subunit